MIQAHAAPEDGTAARAMAFEVALWNSHCISLNADRAYQDFPDNKLLTDENE
jgi:hypothetical protein